MQVFLFFFEYITSDSQLFNIFFCPILICLLFNQSSLLFFKQFFIITIGANQGHQTLIQSIGLYFGPAKTAFVEFQFQSLLYLSFGRVLEKTLFANIMTARKQNNWVPIRRYHQFQTDTTDVGLNFVGNLFAHLLGLSVVILFKRTVHLADQVDCIVLNTLLYI